MSNIKLASRASLQVSLRNPSALGPRRLPSVSLSVTFLAWMNIYRPLNPSIRVWVDSLKCAIFSLSLHPALCHQIESTDWYEDRLNSPAAGTPPWTPWESWRRCPKSPSRFEGCLPVPINAVGVSSTLHLNAHISVVQSWALHSLLVLALMRSLFCSDLLISFQCITSSTAFSQVASSNLELVSGAWRIAYKCWKFPLRAGQLSYVKGRCHGRHRVIWIGCLLCMNDKNWTETIQWNLLKKLGSLKAHRIPMVYVMRKCLTFSVAM